MITIRPAAERGKTEIDWLESRHTFSFNQYYDPEHVHFRKLRVINDDVIAPGGGFGLHPHNDMEIITYILEGAVKHEDSLGTGAVIQRGEIQRMTAGSGIMHSEFNNSNSDPLHLYQIWIFPEKKGLKPGYEQKSFDRSAIIGKLNLLASNEPTDEAVKIHQDVQLYNSVLLPGTSLTYDIADGRSGWIQLASGEIKINGNILKAGDGAAVDDEKQLTIEGIEEAEFLLFDLN